MENWINSFTIFLSIVAKLIYIKLIGLSIITSYNWPSDLLSSSNENNPYTHSDLSYSTFDYIVVGAGAAGSVVAARLSENDNVRVLLIEAGSDPGPISVVPTLYPFGLDESGQLYNYHAQRAPTYGNFYKNNEAVLPVGKMLGGSTGNNGMVFICGTDHDYDNMANYVGNQSLSFSNMLKYRAKMEKNQDITNDPTFHSTTGKVMVTNSTSTDNNFIDACSAGFQQMNYPYIGDYNSDPSSYNGIFDIQFTISGGERCSAARAYLQNVKPNLFVMKNTVVTKVKFNKQNVATGVIIRPPQDSGFSKKQLYANKEVILSAGALNTPKILLQSGVGQSADLSPFGIKQISDVPVGENLQDHIFAYIFVAFNSNAATGSLFDNIGAANNYLFHRTGPLSNLGSTNKQMFLNLDSTVAKYPDIQIQMTSLSKNFDLLRNTTGSLGYGDEVIKVLEEYNSNFDTMIIEAALLHPLSVGSVKLSSSNSLSAPNITAGYFTDTEGSDLSRIIKTFKIVQEFLQTPAMAALSPTIIPFEFTNCHQAGSFWSSAYLDCYRKYFTGTGLHFTGTAKMGEASDPTAVVDQFFRVKGVTKLRVVDASVFPFVFTGNTQCPTYTIAEYAADVIKQTS